MIKANTILKGLAKTYNLEFCPKFHYYTGDAYKDSKGNSLPNYMYLNNRVYTLSYVSGCFKPFVKELKASEFGLIFKDGTSKIEQVVKVGNNYSYKYYSDKFGANFTII